LGEGGRVKVVFRQDRAYWRWGWLGPYSKWDAGIIYTWRMGLGPIQIRGTHDNLDERREAARARKRAIAYAEAAVPLLNAVNRCAAERMQEAINKTKRVWEAA
jgi:hypothetical protein